MFHGTDATREKGYEVATEQRSIGILGWESRAWGRKDPKENEARNLRELKERRFKNLNWTYSPSEERVG